MEENNYIDLLFDQMIEDVKTIKRATYFQNKK